MAAFTRFVAQGANTIAVWFVEVAIIAEYVVVPCIAIPVMALLYSLFAPTHCRNTNVSLYPWRKILPKYSFSFFSHFYPGLILLVCVGTVVPLQTQEPRLQFQ